LPYSVLNTKKHESTPTKSISLKYKKGDFIGRLVAL